MLPFVQLIRGLPKEEYRKSLNNPKRMYGYAARISEVSITTNQYGGLFNYKRAHHIGQTSEDVQPSAIAGGTNSFS